MFCFFEEPIPPSEAFFDRLRTSGLKNKVCNVTKKITRDEKRFGMKNVFL
jgi:hypothetical protein